MALKRGRQLAAKNRAARQEHLREYISKQSTVQHLIANIKKIEELDPESPTFINDLAKLKVANDHRLKLLSKYLPDLKSTEFTDSNGDNLTIEIVRYADSNTERMEAKALPSPGLAVS